MKYNWEFKDKQDKCPSCGATDIYRATGTPLYDVWICKKCGQAQDVKKELPRGKVKLERDTWYNIDTSQDACIWKFGGIGNFEYVGTLKQLKKYGVEFEE